MRTYFQVSFNSAALTLLVCTLGQVPPVAGETIYYIDLSFALLRLKLQLSVSLLLDVFILIQRLSRVPQGSFLP